ncbi:MAG: (Fe-S)-binding protein [Myxococcota bacterium]|nr:(Fe-S)-binding protein [Myxococcota bacterium]
MTLARFDALKDALETCAFCPKLCRFACPVAEGELRESVTPWGLMTHADDLRRGLLGPSAELADLWTHCTGCGACTAHCKHENPVAPTIYALREMARQDGYSHPGLVAWADGGHSSVTDGSVDTRSTTVRVLSGAMAPAELAFARRILTACGYPLETIGSAGPPTGYRWLIAGQLPTFERGFETFIASLEAVETLICVDAEEWSVLTSGRVALPNHIQVRHIVEVCAALPIPLRPVVHGHVFLIDQCRLSRHEPIQEAMVSVLASCITGEIHRPTMHGRSAGCCGAGAGYATVHPELGTRLANEAMQTHSNETIVGFGGCVEHLRAANPAAEMKTWLEVVATALEGQHEAI